MLKFNKFLSVILTMSIVISATTGGSKQKNKDDSNNK